MHYSYEFAGRRLSIETHDDWSATHVEQFLSSFHHSTPHAGCADTVGRILRVRRENYPHIIPADLPRFDVAGGACRAAGHTLYIEIESSVVVVGDSHDAGVELWLADDERSLSPEPLAHVFGYALGAALRRCGVFQLHAAGLVEPAGNRGVCVVGASGSGKTTLAVQLANAGWRYLSDDTLTLTLERSTDAHDDDSFEVEAGAMRRRFSVVEEALGLPRWENVRAAAGGAAAGWRSKRVVSPEVAFPGRFARASRPRLLLFPRLTHEPRTALVPVSPAAAMTELLKFCPWARHDTSTAPAHLRVLARLAAQTAAYRLDAGRDLLENPSLAHELVGAHLPAA